ncbi:MAG TPA: acyl-CoA dehydrogenase family protein [Acidimicrobiales bacterium]
MDLTLTDDQELIATTAHGFLEARCPMAHVREMEADATGYSPGLWKEMAELGWTGLAFPEEHGGAGGTFLDLCLVVEQMGRVQLPSPFLPTVVLCGTALAAHGTGDQRASRLGAIARGERIMSYARAAPGSGWDPSGSDVAARRDGDGFVLDGTAMFVPYAHVADELVVVAQQAGGGPRDLTAFLVDGNAPGLSTRPLHTVHPGHEQRVELDGVRVPAGDLLGDELGGAAVVATVAAHGAAATCAEMVGGAQQVLGMTVQYASEREQFDTPVGAFQAVQHHCANMGVDVLTSRLIAFEAIWRLSEGLDATEEVSMAKAWVSEAYRRVCALGHQVHGAIGFTREHDLHYFLRHAVATELAFGDGDHHWERVARHLGLPERRGGAD